MVTHLFATILLIVAFHWKKSEESEDFIFFFGFQALNHVKIIKNFKKNKYTKIVLSTSTQTLYKQEETLM